VSNGIKYTSEGFVKVKSELSADGNKVVFKVIDTGVGEMNTQGCGLGLSISKLLASALNGDLTFDSEYGKGSTFILTVPLKNQNDEIILEVDESETYQSIVVKEQSVGQYNSQEEYKSNQELISQSEITLNLRDGRLQRQRHPSLRLIEQSKIDNYR
jgi:hypothetical protein